MDLVYTDNNLVEQGILNVSSADFAYGQDENTFSIILNDSNNIINENSLIYQEQGEIGGIVKGISISSSKEVTITGLTWSGLFGQHILEPPAGQAYFTITNLDPVDAVNALISQLKWNTKKGQKATVLFDCVSSKIGTKISHTFKGSHEEGQEDTGRYMNGWAALWQLIYQHNLSISFSYDSETKKVYIGVTKQVEHLDDEDLFITKNSVEYKKNQSINHLIALGQGELAERQVCHVYLDGDGSIVTTQKFFDDDERAEIYECSNAEDATELLKEAKKKLIELYDASQEINVDADNLNFNLGDKISGEEQFTGLVFQAIISKKIIKSTNSLESYEYQTIVLKK